MSESLELMREFVLESRLWKTAKTVPLFGAMLKVYIMQEGESLPTQRQIEVLYSLNDLTDHVLKDIANHALEYFRQVDAVVNLAGEGIVIDESRIECYFRFESILIPELGECETNYFFVSADCDWEPEHGMEVLVGDGRVFYCGDHSSLPFSSVWKEVTSAPRERQEVLLRQAYS